jgi:2-oxoglutarate dehydrogenase E1 component
MAATRSEQLETTPLFGSNADYVEALYEQFLADPASVDQRWREYFASLPSGPRLDHAHRSIQAAIAERARSTRVVVSDAATATDARSRARSRA